MSSRGSSRESSRTRRRHHRTHEKRDRPERSVSREKYEKLKYQTQEWYERSQDLQEKNEKLLVLNEELERENEKLSGNRQELTNSLSRANAEVKKLRDNTAELPDADLFDELESENKSHRKTIRDLKKQLKELEEKYSDRTTKMERDLMLKDGKVQRLEEANKDLKERYRELKEDFREQQRWQRGGVATGRD